MITHKVIPKSFGQYRVVSYSSFPSRTLSGGVKASSVPNEVPSSYHSNELDLEMFSVNLL